MMPGDIIYVQELPLESRREKVTVAGAVVSPGVYYLNPGQRISDILEEAGGYTDKAFGCMILVVDIPDKNDKLISIVLGSQDRFGDTKKLIDWVKEAYRWE